MAVGEGSNEPEGDDRIQTENGTPPPATATRAEDESEEEDEEDEPRLKYATLTKNLSSLYRNGDASSAIFVAGDKMVLP
jgi:vacuolar protein sorting-associated protein 41